MSDSLPPNPAPGAAPVLDSRQPPRGVLPRRGQTWLMVGVAGVLLGIILLVFATRRRPVHLRDQLDRRHQRQKAQRGFELDQEGLAVGDPAGPDLGVGDGGDAAGDPASGRPAPETLGLVALAPDARFASAASGEHDG